MEGESVGIHDVLGCPQGEVALMCGVGGNGATVLDDKGFSSVPTVCSTKGGCGQQSYIMDQLRYMGGMVGTGWWLTKLVCAYNCIGSW
jgi:hypothetical protein